MFNNRIRLGTKRCDLFHIVHRGLHCSENEVFEWQKDGIEGCNEPSSFFGRRYSP